MTLDIVHMAFQHPESIIEPVNRMPRTALFLLQHLASTNGAPTARITTETKFLQAVTLPTAANSSHTGNAVTLTQVLFEE